MNNLLLMGTKMHAAIISLVLLLGAMHGHSEGLILKLESELIDQYTPEELVCELGNEKFDASVKYQLFTYYMDRGQYDMALRAGLQLVEMNPAEGEAHAALGYIYFQLKRFDEAQPEFKKAYEMGRVNSVIPLVVIMYLRSADFMAEVDPYISALENLRISNIDAYQPLIMYGLKLDVASRRKYSERIFSGVNFAALLENEKNEEWLLIFFRSLDDKDRISEIEKARSERRRPNGG